MAEAPAAAPLRPRPSRPGGSARATAYWEAGGQTPGEQLAWKRALAARHARGLVVDVGCGDGASSVAGAVGLDGAAEPLRRAAARGVLAVRADVEAPWPLRDAVAGTVCLFDVLEHVPDPQPLLAEAQRVLAPGGILLVALPNAAHLANRAAALLGRTTDFTDTLHRTGAVLSDHLHRFTTATGARLLSEAGFAVTARHDFLPTAFSEAGWRWASPAARLLHRWRAHERLPGLLAYEFLWVCRRPGEGP